MPSLWQFDQTVLRDINVGWHQSWLDPVFWMISSSGLGWVQVIFLLCLLLWRNVFASPYRPVANIKSWLKRPPGTLIVLFAWAVTGALDQLCKQLVPRERPSDLAWSLPQEQISWHSFASGHTAGSFGIAFTVFFLTRETRNWRLGVLALVWAGLVGFSRVYRGVHWPTDVISGFFVGLGSSCLVMLAFPEQKIRSREQAESPWEVLTIKTD